MPARANYPKPIEMPWPVDSIHEAAILRARTLKTNARFHLANGHVSDQKLSLENLFGRRHEQEAAIVFGGLRRLVERLEPNGLIGVPRGGDLFAQRLAELMGLEYIPTEKNKLYSGPKKPAHERSPEEKFYISPESVEQAREVGKIVVLEDVVTSGVSTAKFIELLNDKTSEDSEEPAEVAGIVGVWFRGQRDELMLPEDIPVEFLVEKHIPSKMPSELL